MLTYIFLICVRVCVCGCVCIYMCMYVCIYIYISLYRMYVQFVSSSIGEWGWGGSTSLWERLLPGVGAYFWKIGVLSVVFSIFNAGESVCMCVCVCVYAHTYTHCTDGVLGCEPRSRDQTLGGPEESRWTKSRHTYICIRVQSTHVYIYAKRWDEILD